MDFKKEDSGQTGTLKLDGELCIQRAAELKRILLNAQKGAGPVLLNLEGVTDVDLSGLQLICAAHRLAVKSNKSLSIDVSARFRQAAMDAGYKGDRGCTFDQDQTCLWRRG